VTPASRAGRLGLWSATALVVSHTVAVGIFLTPAEVIGALQSPAWTFALWLGCGAIVLAGALTFGELASRYPETGGLYVYLRETWGPSAAFLYGWQSLLVMDPGVVAALAAGTAQYLSVLWPSAAGSMRVLAVAVIWIGALPSMAGLRMGARTFDVLTVVKLCVLAGVVIIALTTGHGDWSHFTPFAGARTSALPIGEALAGGLIGVFFSFGGFWETGRIAGDVEHARRVVPLALTFGVAIVIAIYVMTTIAFIYLVPPSATTSASAFALLAGRALAGPAGPAVLATAVVCSVAPSIMAVLIVAPRLYEAMSLDRLFPRALAVRTASGSPARATAVLATLASVLVFLGTFDQIVAFFVCAALVFVGLAAAGVFVVRRRPGDAAFPVPGYPLTPALFILLVAVVVAMIAVARPWQALAGAALVLVGLPVRRWLIPRAEAAQGRDVQ
jgi:APA family basic amino acid/polyamine antiporter